MAIDLNLLGMLIAKLNPYTDEMEPPTAHPPAAPPQAGDAQTEAAGAADAEQVLAHGRRQFQIELDDLISNYSSAQWTFRGSPQSIKRALRITYRYQLKDISGHNTGFYATEHLLIGYAGGNGG